MGLGHRVHLRLRPHGPIMSQVALHCSYASTELRVQAHLGEVYQLWQNSRKVSSLQQHGPTYAVATTVQATQISRLGLQ